MSLVSLSEYQVVTRNSENTIFAAPYFLQSLAISLNFLEQHFISIIVNNIVYTSMDYDCLQGTSF